MAENATWYYAAGGGQRGPVTREQVSALVTAGAVTGETLVWSQGMADWTPLPRTDLASLLRAAQPPAPPPVPPRPADPVPVPPAAAWGSQASSSPGYGPGGPGGQAVPRYGAAGPAPGYTPSPGYAPALAPMGMGQAISACFGKYATFQGRARRAEFWYFYLFMMVVHVVLMIVASSTIDGRDLQTYYAIVSVDGLFALVMLLPMLAVTVRRLHDTDRSGWWWWIQLVPLLGVILLIVFAAEAGTPGPNRYGEPPV